MTDRREQTLARLTVIMAEIPSIQAAVRNRGELPANKRPAIVVLDGDEVARESVAQQRGRLTLAPHLVDLTPEIFIVMDQREPHNVGIGEDLNALRIAVLKAIIADQELVGILGANGDIRYNGCNTDMATGRAMEGQMQLSITFTYALRPSEL
jgi:hypothetical protein